MILLSVVMAFGYAISTASATRANVTVQVDGKNVTFPDAKPYVEQSRVLIPVRFVSESLGAKVDYKKETTGNKVNRTIIITQSDKTVHMNVNSDKVLVGDKIITLDVPARLQQERVYVPLRFVSEALGATVDWNSSKSLVSISTGAVVTDPEPVPDPKNEFGWKPGYNELAKELFVNNAKVSNGKFTITIPKDATVSYYPKNSLKKTVLTPGKQYTYALKEGQGSLSIDLIYPGKPESEHYAIFLDGKGKEINATQSVEIQDVVVSGNNGKWPVEATLSEVVQLAESL
ncbi:copper amine oxidase N-terminal domain-containing protein [Paenibacillus polymyxa]|uniref:copper amine oxidase N-terminal domain-containing protein n=1 Tax=Paenibacillus polymyxa TaxID=1406 RepID=UPI002AB53617|nr:copper amine oxidase N-terminal domain-containing protein [Paenibacillus polymyxa]MDY8116810.1 copper amine oxidase N-terminal domain-containing protein [Paenibacillus polymyxa]